MRKGIKVAKLEGPVNSKSDMEAAWEALQAWFKGVGAKTTIVLVSTTTGNVYYQCEVN